GAESLGAFRRRSSRHEGSAGTPPSGIAARRHGREREHAREARDPACRIVRRAVQRPWLDVGTQARRLPRSRIHNRLGCEAALTPRARTRTLLAAPYPTT